MEKTPSDHEPASHKDASERLELNLEGGFGAGVAALVPDI